MATVKAIKYGMKGDDVSNLQTSLKNAGYNIDVDGSFGPQTLAAVKDYQQKNGLTVDGMVGPQTQAALFGGTSASTPANTTPTSGGASNNTSGATSGTNATSGSAASPSTNIQMPDAPAYEAYNAPDYAESETVQQAYATLQAILAAQPGAYESKWQGQINEMIDRILNREKFTYDINSDALYQQYADQYKNLGKLAMQDTMGQAAAMTGGYGNSYAQSVGQQAYQGYLSQLNEMVPELYGMALDQYNREGQEMYNQYGLLSDQEAQDYGRYRDAYNNWLAERDYATGRYDTESAKDYDRWYDSVMLDYQTHTDEQDRRWNEYVTGTQQAKEHVMTMISAGVMPDASALEAAGISQADAEALIGAVNTEKQNGVNSENREYNYKTAMSMLSAGIMPSAEMLAAAGISEADAAAMVNSVTDETGTPKGLSANDIKGISSQVADLAENGNLEAAEAYLTYLEEKGYITKEEARSFLAPYVNVEEDEVVDTTVPNISTGVNNNTGSNTNTGSNPLSLPTSGNNYPILVSPEQAGAFADASGLGTEAVNPADLMKLWQEKGQWTGLTFEEWVKTIVGTK